MYKKGLDVHMQCFSTHVASGVTANIQDKKKHKDNISDGSGFFFLKQYHYLSYMRLALKGSS